MGRRRLVTTFKLQLPAGQASPAPPVGTALGPHGVNLMDFVKAYNDATASQRGQIVPVEISIYEDRSFDFVMKTPPAAALLRQAARVDKGSGEPNKEKVGKVTRAQIKEIAETKMPDLNAIDIEGDEDRRGHGPIDGYNASATDVADLYLVVGTGLGREAAGRLDHKEETMAKHGKKYREAMRYDNKPRTGRKRPWSSSRRWLPPNSTRRSRLSSPWESIPRRQTSSSAARSPSPTAPARRSGWRSSHRRTRQKRPRRPAPP